MASFPAPSICRSFRPNCASLCQLRNLATPRISGPATDVASPAAPCHVRVLGKIWAGVALGRFLSELEHRIPPDVALAAAVQFLSTEGIHPVSSCPPSPSSSSLCSCSFPPDFRKLFQTLLPAISVLGTGMPMLLLMMWIWRAPHPFLPGSWNSPISSASPSPPLARPATVQRLHRYTSTAFTRHDPAASGSGGDTSAASVAISHSSFGYHFAASPTGDSRDVALGFGQWPSASSYLATVIVLRDDPATCCKACNAEEDLCGRRGRGPPPPPPPPPSGDSMGERIRRACQWTGPGYLCGLHRSGVDERGLLDVFTVLYTRMPRGSSTTSHARKVSGMPLSVDGVIHFGR